MALTYALLWIEQEGHAKITNYGQFLSMFQPEREAEIVDNSSWSCFHGVERWRADWDDIVAMTRIADEAGLEFILPVAKWRGFQGKANIYGRSFETLTHGAALGALTKHIAIFSTVHVPLVTPAFGAKAIATIDHITHGRAGFNIVCGWNQEEFDLHGVTIDHDRRYDHGLEWFRVWSRMLQGGPEFDWDGEFFHLKRLQTDPVSVQRPWPAVMSAGFSPKGRDFAAQNLWRCLSLQTSGSDLRKGPLKLSTRSGLVQFRVQALACECQQPKG